MIQFQPAQDVKDALTGKKDTTATPQTDDPSLKPPLAMSLANSPKLAGIFKNSTPGTTTTPQPAVTEPIPETATSEPASAAETAAGPMAGQPEAVPATDTQETASPTVMTHEPTDPHGVHDEAHPDEPEPKESAVTLSPAEPVVTAAPPQPEAVPAEQPAVGGTSAAQPAATPVTSTLSETEAIEPPAVSKEEFLNRLKAALSALDQEIAKAQQDEEQAMSEAAKATALVKSKKAEREQLKALENLDPAMLASVFKVMQPQEEKNSA